MTRLSAVEACVSTTTTSSSRHIAATAEVVLDRRTVIETIRTSGAKGLLRIWTRIGKMTGLSTVVTRAPTCCTTSTGHVAPSSIPEAAVIETRGTRGAAVLLWVGTVARKMPRLSAVVAVAVAAARIEPRRRIRSKRGVLRVLLLLVRLVRLLLPIETSAARARAAVTSRSTVHHDTGRCRVPC
eukprot:COSAG06_NODE_1124_length_10620_cov_48.182587_2_plen_184_part_00